MSFISDQIKDSGMYDHLVEQVIDELEALEKQEGELKDRVKQLEQELAAALAAQAQQESMKLFAYMEDVADLREGKDGIRLYRHKAAVLDPIEVSIHLPPAPEGENPSCRQCGAPSGNSHCLGDIFNCSDLAAPEYQEPEQLCDDGGKCGAGGYCNNCAAPVVKENGKLRERLANQHAKIEQLEADNEVLRKQAERYEKLRKLDARQLAEIFRMNIQGGVRFDELVDRLEKDE